MSNNNNPENPEENVNIEKKPQKKSFVNIFKMKRIPILQVDVDLGINLPKGFNMKSLKKKLGIFDDGDVSLTGRELISVAGETISFVESTGLENLEPTMLDLSGFMAVYIPKDNEFTKGKIRTLIETYKRIFPYTKLGKPLNTFLPICKEDDNTTNWNLINPLLKSLEYRLEKLRTATVEQRSLPSDSVNLRSQLAQFNNLDELITSLRKNAHDNNCMKKEEEEAEKVEEEDISLLLRKFAFLLLLRKEDRAVDKKNLVKQLEEEFPIKLEEYEPEMRKQIRKFLDETSQKTRGGGDIEDNLETLDTEMNELSTLIQAIEVKDSPTKKEKRELVKKQKELNSLFKKRVALEETLSELENKGEYTIETKQLPDLVDSIYPELQNSKFLKFEKELNEKLRH
jgi:hypothetical protein